MLLYSIIPAEEVFRGMEGPSPSLVDVVAAGVQMQVEPTGAGRGKIVRLLSTDPADYLRAELQPGNVIGWVPTP